MSVNADVEVLLPETVLSNLLSNRTPKQVLKEMSRLPYMHRDANGGYS